MTAALSLAGAACGSSGTSGRGRDAGSGGGGDAGPGGGTDAGSAPRCGDDNVDPGETCDDGNTTAGDGCNAECKLETPTAFRADTLALISPRIVVDVPIAGCKDLTQDGVSVFGTDVDSINTGLMAGVSVPDASGHYSSNLVQVFRPLDPAAATTLLDVDGLGIDGCAAGSPISCMLDALANVQHTVAHDSTSGSCLSPMAALVNAHASSGSVSPYSPSANAPAGPCYVSEETIYPVDVSGTSIPLSHAQIAAQFAGGSPASGLVNGVIAGFLTEAQAQTTLLPASLPSVGGMPLYAVLQAGGAPGSACNVDGGAAEDDRDPDPDNPSLQGFWFFINFTATVVDWTSP